MADKNAEQQQHVVGKPVTDDYDVDDPIYADLYGSLDKKELNKAKKASKKARKQAYDAAQAARSASEKEEKRRKQAQFKTTVRGNAIVDEEGNFVRKYTLPERLLDNKPFAWAIVGLFIAILFTLMILQPAVK